MISVHEFQRFTESKEQAKKRFFEIVDELREYNQDITYAEIEKDVAQAVAEVKHQESEKLEKQSY